MANEEVGIRIALQGNRDAARDVKEVEEGIEQVGTTSEVAAKKTSRAMNVIRGGVRGVGRGIGVIGSFVKRGVLAATAAGVATIGTALYKGFNRLQGIEDATASLSGLGNSAKDVRAIMDNALSSVRGTAFGMSEAAQTAAGAVAAGVKPGKDLERTLKLVADAATIGKSSMGEMGSIFNKVATSGRVQGDVLNQLGDRGIPIVQLLAQEMGVTAAEVADMSRKGTIDFNTFRNAMERGMGGAALESGNTTTGALKNVGAALSRLGATAIGRFYPLFRRVFKQATIVIDGLTERLAPLMDRMFKTFGPPMGRTIQGSGKRILKWIDRQADSVGKLVDAYKRGGGIRGMVKNLIPKTSGGDATTMASIGASIGVIGDAVDDVDWDQVRENFGQGASDTFSVFATVIGFLADNVDTLAKYLPALIAGWAAYRVAQAAANVASVFAIPLQAMMLASQVAHTFALRANTAATVTNTTAETTATAVKTRSTAATIAQSVATKAAAAAQKVLNVVMRANPLGLVIAAIALLVGGFILLYKKSDTFRGMVDGLWNNVLVPFGEFLGGVLVGYLKLVAKMWLMMGRFGIKAFTWLLKAAFKAFDGILSAAEKGLGWVPGLGGKIKKARTAFNEFGDATINKLERLDQKLKTTQDKIDGIARDRSATINITTAYTNTKGFNPTRGRADEYGSPDGRARGGPVAARTPYIVGEHRPELFVPNVPGMIVPKVPDLSDLGDVDMSVGPVGPRGATVLKVVMPDGRVLLETVIDEFDDAEANA